MYIVNKSRRHLAVWRTGLNQVNELEDISEDYISVRNRNVAAQHLRSWRMHIFQLRGPAMQSDLFRQRSERLKLRLMLRLWRQKLKAKHMPDMDSNEMTTIENTDRAHTAPITPRRSTRRYAWRNTYSR
jgi:hypothetical protein